MNDTITIVPYDTSNITISNVASQSVMDKFKELEESKQYIEKWITEYNRLTSKMQDIYNYQKQTGKEQEDERFKLMGIEIDRRNMIKNIDYQIEIIAKIFSIQKWACAGEKHI